MLCWIFIFISLLKNKEYTVSKVIRVENKNKNKSENNLLNLLTTKELLVAEVTWLVFAATKNIVAFKLQI